MLPKQVRGDRNSHCCNANTPDYGNPTVVTNWRAIHYTAQNLSIPSGIRAFAKELSKYKQAKGSVQFPFDKPMPYSLVAKVVKYRVKENLEKEKTS